VSATDPRRDDLLDQLRRKKTRAPGDTKTWAVVPSGGLSGTPIPAGAQDLVLTVTVLNPAAGGGTLLFNPGAGPAYPAITVDPNVAGPASYVIVVPVGPGGTVAVTSTSATDLAIDVDGFYLSTLAAGDRSFQSAYGLLPSRRGPLPLGHDVPVRYHGKSRKRLTQGFGARKCYPNTYHIALVRNQSLLSRR
jgi:hypothetical protein